MWMEEGSSDRGGVQVFIVHRRQKLGLWANPNVGKSGFKLFTAGSNGNICQFKMGMHLYLLESGISAPTPSAVEGARDELLIGGGTPEPCSVNPFEQPVGSSRPFHCYLTCFNAFRWGGRRANLNTGEGMFVSPSAIELGDLNITPLQQRVFVVREISPLALVTLRSKAASAHAPCSDM